MTTRRSFALLELSGSFFSCGHPRTSIFFSFGKGRGFGDTGRKVDDPEVLEAIRLTVINNLLQYHPGLLAKAKFHVSYKGEAIIKPLQQVLANSLRYFLRRPTTEEASF
ncbi:ACT domain-containing protein ACR11 [Citrus sinensis]|uniref:ACT domain-containing protein ACR11 n=1 Tax=Citrus sinensis TaxID=2711 RepID=A0ACB8JEI1_CITSI|nr:ACT domain-containing protein ACR11 [Citrus sinensis]